MVESIKRRIHSAGTHTWMALSEATRPGFRVSKPQPIPAAVYFVSFILLGTMIMLNLFTGVIISSMEEAQAERSEETRDDHLKKKGFLTLHDELTLLSEQLKNISVRLKGLELKEERQEREEDEEMAVV